MSVLLTAGKLVLLYSDRRMIEFVNKPLRIFDMAKYRPLQIGVVS